MSTSLSGQYLDAAFGDLLQVSNSGSGVDTTLRTVADGQGTDSALQLSTTVVNINGTFKINGYSVTLTGNHTLGFTLTADTALTLPTTGTLATLAGSETFVNKTLTAPVIATILNTGILTLPTSTDTLIGRATIDTLTNKTLTSPVMTTPTLGVATATSINKVAITAPASGSTLTIADGATLTVSGTATVPAGTTLVAANNLSDVSTVTTALTNLYSTNAITTTATLTLYGQMVTCGGSSAYTVTLPAVSSGKFLDILCKTTSNAIVTLSPASGTISGQATIKLGTNDAVTLYSDGSNWFIIKQVLAPAMCLVQLSANQSITNNTVTKVTLDTEVFDVGGFYDNATNYRFTPLLPGKYHVGLVENWSLQSSAFTASAYLYKNGSSYATANISPTASANNQSSGSLTTIVSMNGTTDYLEAFCIHAFGSSINLVGNNNWTAMNISRVSLF